MLYLQTDQSEGGQLYFDVQRVEERSLGGRNFFAVSGICGDGRWEGEILVEVGERVTVTFVDEWLDAGRLREFLERHERERIEAALAEIFADLHVCLESRPVGGGQRRRQVVGCAAQGRWLPQRPRNWGEQLDLPLGVAEAAPGWRRRAA